MSQHAIDDKAGPAVVSNKNFVLFLAKKDFYSVYYTLHCFCKSMFVCGLIILLLPYIVTFSYYTNSRF